MSRNPFYKICYLKSLICGILILLYPSLTYGQLKNFGTKAKNKPEPNYFISIYAYGDLIRESGVGFQYLLANKFGMDFSFYLINKHVSLAKIIKQWDYYDFSGFGFSFKPKHHFGLLNRSYVGLNFAYERIHHNRVSVEKWGTDAYKELEDADGYGYTIGITLGKKIPIKHYFLEPFFGIGLTFTEQNRTNYENNSYKYGYQDDTPKYYKDEYEYFQLNLGLKFGFSFKKSKKHQALDKKFDAVYIPKATSLIKYIQTIDFTNPTISADIKRARNRIDRLDRRILRLYNRFYCDTSNLYKKIDSVFYKIDELIIKGNQQK